MVHGKTEEMRRLDSQQEYKEPEFVEGTKWAPIKMGEGDRAQFFKPRGLKPFVGASRDRRLGGKARIKARRAAKKG